jgi:CBS domain-containing protein
MAGTTVGEICVWDVVSISEDTTVEDIATIMSEKKIHVLPVVRDGVIVGIVGKADVVGSMTGETFQQE